MGWEPRTVYEYDDAGRMVASAPEPEWDDTERAWMLALEHWRTEQVCSLCGWPKAICQDPATEFAVEVPVPTRCHVTTALRRAQKARAEDKTSESDGLVWAAQMRSDN